MVVSHPETILTTLHAAAKTLRTVADGQEGPQGETFGFRRSTLGLAALIESWCVDNAAFLMPELLADFDADSSVDERALFDRIIAHIAHHN